MSAAATIGNAPLRFGEIEVDVRRLAGGVMVLQAKTPFTPPDERLHDYVRRNAESFPDRLLIAERKTPDGPFAGLTYAQAYAKARAIAANLVTRELSVDRPIAILSGNSVDHFILGLAAMMAGVPYAPISSAYSTLSADFDKLRHIFALLDPGLVYADDGAIYGRALAIPEMQGREIVLGANVDKVPGAVALDSLCSGGSLEKLDALDVSINSETIAKFLFTSGSTGVPKGVITTHKMMVSSIEQVRLTWPFIEEQPLVFVDWLPWSHVFGGSKLVNLVLRFGGTFYIDDGKPVPKEAWKTARNLREIAPTNYWSVPKGYEFLVADLDKDEDLRKKFFSNLRTMFYAGASLPGPIWEKLERYGREVSGRDIPMLTSWGLTETAPGITTVNRAHAGVGNVGVPMPGLELKLLPNHGKMEARVRGPNITPGYWKMPEATKGAFDLDGYFKTADALLFASEAHPGRGMRFDGRVSEDFKLLTGTWVNVADIRQKTLEALTGLASNVVVAAPDRDDLGLLIVAPAERDPEDPDYWAEIARILGAYNKTASGASQRIARAMVMEVPPSLDTGEMTDKGSLNSRAILQKRSFDVDRLYLGKDEDIIFPAE